MLTSPPPADPRTGTPAAPQTDADTDTALPPGLRQRHLAMIALGGAIGAGLFVGSGVGIRAAGPAIIVSYVVAGLLVLLVMRMLAEMSAAQPATGSFSVYAAKALGPWAGLTAGWLYWSLLVVSVAAEAIGAADIVTKWVPGVPGYVWMTVFMALFTGSNLAAVRRFGDLEFWFAGLKIAAICAFLLLGALAVLDMLPGTADSPGTAHLTDHGGFLPHGWHGVALGMVAAVFAYGGLETVTIAAAESDDPARAVGRAARTVVWRICLFYIGSMAIIVTLLPWNSPGTDAPYSGALETLGIPGAAHIMNAVVLVALLSAMNANIYGSSRMLYALVRRGDAPRALGRVTGGVPRGAVLASAAFGFVSVLLSVAWPETVFPFLLNTVGATILIVWLLIALSQLRLRRRLEQEAPERLVVKMWLFPYLTWLALLTIGGVLLMMVFEAESRTQVICTGIWTAVLLGCAWLKRTRAERLAEQLLEA
ncbi:amino acid permease [Streptomyces sp. NBC_01304]|uniref:amino acid permease n=1 Tax=Streptomyces sp. NBC_01304 TaxID=2903818 RepID=UPI002E0FFFDB|nr:amino acid permease [Streptomyces sp. NBC_01304]